LWGWGTTASAQAFPCGDANGDEAIDVGDVVYLIAFVFKGGPPPGMLCEGDVNGDGQVNVGDAVYLINWMFRGGPPPVCMPPYSLNDQFGCKTFWKSGYPPDVDCMVYNYDGGTLSLQHYNAGFNCCPEQIVVDMWLVGDTIMIEEIEINGDCFCMCLFDLDMQMNYLEPGYYVIRVIEPYVDSSEVPLDFAVDLVAEPDGEYCVPRQFYPWETTTQPGGSLIGQTGCKYMKDSPTDTLPPNQDCLIYTYDGQDRLTITHANTCFNCCILNTTAAFSYAGNMVTIDEGEVLEEGGCDCQCLYDVEYEITGLPPGEYTFVVNGMYLGSNMPIEVTLDLTTAGSGQMCVTRTGYPWEF
jgi:hypothetical protein